MFLRYSGKYECCVRSATQCSDLPIISKDDDLELDEQFLRFIIFNFIHNKQVDKLEQVYSQIPNIIMIIISNA